MWFKTKNYGWGWTPASWQGWAVIGAWVAFVLLLLKDLESEPTASSFIWRAIAFVFSIGLLIFISCWKGEKPQWRWQGRNVAPRVVMRKTVQLLIFILIAQIAGIIGTFFTFDAIPTWYATLTKPFFAPPNWLFAPVWITLYTLMGIAAFFAWDLRYEKTHAARGMNWYWTQLILNAIWSPIFFGLQNIGLALIIIVLMWLAIVMTMREFFKVNLWLGILLVPYLAWVSFATVLTYTLWTLN